jgi:class 3 adenylate cyclase
VTVTAAVRLAIENERMLGEIEARASEARTLPIGFVTLLLADIEDSTGLVRRLGKRYAAVLADVRRLLRTAIRVSDGREVDARADEMFAVFARAEGALAAALAMQRRVLAHAWPDEIKLRIRVGLHSGRPTLTDSGYVGMVVNTASRVCYAGRGGQIVLSTDARDAILVSQPAGVGFKDLGLHQLQGLPAAVALFQVLADDLPFEFAPPRTQSRLPGADESSE